MIVNLLFSKSGKGLNSILKNPTEKLMKNVALLVLHKKPKLQTCLKGGKIVEHVTKKPAKLNNSSIYTVINDNSFRWSESSLTIILIHIFSGLNLLKT